MYSSLDWLKVMDMTDKCQPLSKSLLNKDSTRLFHSGGQTEVLRLPDTVGTLHHMSFKDPLQQTFYLTLKDALWKYAYDYSSTGICSPLMFHLALKGVREVAKARYRGALPMEALRLAQACSQIAMKETTEGLDVDVMAYRLGCSLGPYSSVTYLETDGVRSARPVNCMKFKAKMAPELPLLSDEVRYIGDCIVLIGDQFRKESYPKISQVLAGIGPNPDNPIVILYRGHSDEPSQTAFEDYLTRQGWPVFFVPVKEPRNVYSWILRGLVQRQGEHLNEVLSDNSVFQLGTTPVRVEIARDAIFIYHKMDVGFRHEGLEDIASNPVNVEAHSNTQRNEAVSALSRLYSSHAIVNLPKQDKRPLHEKIQEFEQQMMMVQAQYEGVVEVSVDGLEQTFVYPKRDVLLMVKLLNSLFSTISLVEVFVPQPRLGK